MSNDGGYQGSITFILAKPRNKTDARPGFTVCCKYLGFNPPQGRIAAIVTHKQSNFVEHQFKVNQMICMSALLEST